MKHALALLVLEVNCSLLVWAWVNKHIGRLAGGWLVVLIACEMVCMEGMEVLAGLSFSPLFLRTYNICPLASLHCMISEEDVIALLVVT